MTRADTLFGVEACEYVAVIYKDVTLTRDRWDFWTEPEMAGADRILMGAPLWIRATGPMRTYFGANRVVLPA